MPDCIYIFRRYKMWWELFEFCFFSYLIIQLVRLVLADADLTLLWKEKFGKKPGIKVLLDIWLTFDWRLFIFWGSGGRMGWVLVLTKQW